jgi:hypothetical protein
MVEQAVALFICSGTGPSWKTAECRPRRACHALHCGQVPHLNDDFEAIRISSAIIEAPPLSVWPTVERRCRLPSDVEAFLEQLNVQSDEEPDRHAQV